MSKYNAVVGVTFSDTFGDIREGIHTYKKYGALLKHHEITTPAAKTYEVDVPFHNGSLDLTNAYSKNVFFNNRKLTITLKFLEVYDRWAYYYSMIENDLHGRNKYVCFDEDSRFYYYGRCAVDPFKSNRITGTIVINVNVEPYKMEIATVNEIKVKDGWKTDWLWDPFSFVDGVINDSRCEVSGTASIDFYNLKKPVKPEMRAEAAMTIVFDGKSYSLSGDNKWHEMPFYLYPDKNTMKVTGNGIVWYRRRGGLL
ncbi:MAG: hypothetical protein MJ097_00425 [Dorea sp.]|nr:hypothetical protein [Dorea sp.]